MAIVVDSLSSIRRNARLMFTDIANAGERLGKWFVSQAKGFWGWAKKHPILASTLIAGIIAAAAFPPLYALLPAVPLVGAAVMSLIASAPYWAAPITTAFSVAAAFISSAFIVSVVSGLKKLFSGSARTRASAADPVYDLENDPSEFEIVRPQTRTNTPANEASTGKAADTTRQAQATDVRLSQSSHTLLGSRKHSASSIKSANAAAAAAADSNPDLHRTLSATLV